MDYQLRDRTCLVSGASSGIGAGVVRLLSQQGARIVATARRVEKIERLDGVTVFAGDVTDPADLARIATDAS
jgi:3-oxoacyl-[acyl-carrier protein] reductase